MSYTLLDIGQAIQKERGRRGHTQRHFASLAGTTQARVSNIENGEIDVRLSTLIELARTLDLDVMLVPRQHVPAIRAIITQQPQSSEEKSTRAVLTRLGNLILQLRERFPDDAGLANLDRYTRELSNFKMTRMSLAPIQKVIDALRTIQNTPALINTLDAHTDSLRRLRNDLAHNIHDDIVAPRPAYRLDDEDDE